MSRLRVPPRFRLRLCAAAAAGAVSAHGQKLALFPRCTGHVPAGPVYRVATGGVLHRFNRPYGDGLCFSNPVG